MKSPYIKIGGGGATSKFTPAKTNDFNESVEANPSPFLSRAQSAVNLSIEAPNKISELSNMYEQLNRVVHNLASRISDQERRLNKITQSGIVMEHYGGPSNGSTVVTARNGVSPNALAFSNLTSSPHVKSLRDLTAQKGQQNNLPQIKQSKTHRQNGLFSRTTQKSASYVRNKYYNEN